MDCKFLFERMAEMTINSTLHRFDAWIRALDAYSGNDILYLNPLGVLPDAAIITRGVHREHPFRERKIFDTTSFNTHDKIKKELEGEDDVEEALIGTEHLEETEG